jgi:transglutaminase/protease-like cytokinesis protein 3
VWIEGSWRLVDTTWGAGSYNEVLEEFTFALNEHYFLTDPDELQFSHFPYVGKDPDYDRWQLMPPKYRITLEEFNRKPTLSPAFFELGMDLTEVPSTPWPIQDQAQLRIKAWEVIRYKVAAPPALYSVLSTNCGTWRTSTSRMS